MNREREERGGRPAEAEVYIRPLRAGDYDEALDFLNLVFSMADRPHDFRRALPRMWARDDVHMGRHLAVVRDGRIRAMLGVYPLPAVVAGRRLLFATVGNVATHPYETGRGYMRRLMDVARARLDEMDADASRLGGLRRRYAPYGYEPIGLRYTFVLTARDVRSARRSAGAESGLDFRPLDAADTDLLEQAAALQRRGAMFVERGGPDDFLRTLVAWEARPVAALAGGRVVGYLVAEKDGETVSECVARDDATAAAMLVSWLERTGRDALRVSVEAWRTGLVRLLVPLCEHWSAAAPCNFRIRRWDRVADALLALKRRTAPLPDGEATIGIRGWGALRLSVRGRDTAAERADGEPDFWLEPDRAAQLLAGTVPPPCVCDVPDALAPLLAAWLPLPLSWCELDRV